jgi:geranylgeranyl pyrophosphate synthase
MATEKKLVLQARDLLFERGLTGLEAAQKIMKKEEIAYKPLKEAIDSFISSWKDVVHPALLSLACEAVGGKPENTVNVGAAFVLLAGGADLHDDIIDDSPVKDFKPTVYGKYGKDLTVLAGDALLFKGLCVLHEAVDNLSVKQKGTILDLTKHAFFDISSAEAQETHLRKKTDIADEYLNMIKLKAAVSEATTKIGALLGNGAAGDIEFMGDFGRGFGILFTLRDEFVDILDYKELVNRRNDECLPLPIQLALNNETKKNEISNIIGKSSITQSDAEQLFDLIIDLKENVTLKDEMNSIVTALGKKIQVSKLHRKRQLNLLINSMIEDL